MDRQTKILYGIICFLLFAVIFLLFRGNNAITERDELKKEVEEQKQQIKEEQNSRKKAEQKKDSLSREINNSKDIIINIRNDRDGKLKEVEKYNNSKLQRYFDEKYGK